jgi:hypothetical protein
VDWMAVPEAHQEIGWKPYYQTTALCAALFDNYNYNLN